MSATSGFGGGGVGPVNSVMTLTGNSGGAVPPAGNGNINTLGGNLINVTGVPLSNELTWDLVGGTDGQVIIGATAGLPAFATITSGDGTITFIPGPNSLDIRATGGSLDLTALRGETGGNVLPLAGVIEIRGALAPYKNITTEGNVVANTLDVRLNDVILWPATNAAGTEGAIFLDGTQFLHAYAVGGMLNGNTFTGFDSGNFTLLAQAVANSGYGANTLRALTTGDSNIAIGAEALVSATSASENVGIGVSCLASITTAEFNTAIGHEAGFNLTGSYNTLMGHSAGFNLTTGSSNAYFNHAGVAAENNVLRLGTDGTGFQQQNSAYIAGVRGRTVSSPQHMVIVGPDGKFGSATGSNGSVATSTPTGVQMRAVTSPNNTIVAAYDAVGNSLGLDTAGTIATSYHTDAGNAAPAAGILNVNGDTNVIGTTGSGNTVTAQMLQTSDGWFPIGQTGNPVKYGHLYSSDDSIIITPDFSNPEPRINLRAGVTPGSIVAIANHTPTIPNIIGATVRQYTIGTAGGSGLTSVYDPFNALFLGNGAGTPFSFTAPADGIYSFATSLVLSGAFSRFFNTFNEAPFATSCTTGQLSLSTPDLPVTSALVGLVMNYIVNGSLDNYSNNQGFGSSMATSNTSNPPGNLAWGTGVGTLNATASWGSGGISLNSGDIVTLRLENMAHPSFVGTPAFADASGILPQSTIGVVINPYTPYASFGSPLLPASQITNRVTESAITVIYTRPF